MKPKQVATFTEIRTQKRIDLFLYSPGGLTIAGFALVNLIREFGGEFNVLIQFRALSCATLISVGADEVVMSPMAQLSPIDPSLEHPLGPTVQMPGQPPRGVPVNVEDVSAFSSLGKEMGLSEEESMRRIFEKLADQVYPMVLGAVHRSRDRLPSWPPN